MRDALLLRCSTQRAWAPDTHECAAMEDDSSVPNRHHDEHVESGAQPGAEARDLPWRAFETGEDAPAVRPRRGAAHAAGASPSPARAALSAVGSDAVFGTGPSAVGGGVTPGGGPCAGGGGGGGGSGNAPSSALRAPGPGHKERAAGAAAAGSMHHGGSFGVYMHHKNLKLREQFEAQALGGQPRSDLFRGVTIHVNGYTVPSHQELKQLMALHGGNFETYFSRDLVTHVVCAHLPDAKLKQLSSNPRKPVAIVRPEWVVASLRAGQLLPVKDFALEAIRDAPHQRKLTDFARHQAAGVEAAELYPRLEQRQAEQRQAEQPAPGSEEVLSDQRRAAQLRLRVEDAAEGRPGGDGAVEGQAASAERELQRVEGGDEEGRAGLAGAQAWEEPGSQALALQQPPSAAGHAQPLPPQQQGQQQPPQPPASRRQQLDAAQALAARLRAECDVLKGAPRSTADDPNFMNTYFRSSRLHWIGCWKSRIESLMSAPDPGAPNPTPPRAPVAAAAAAAFAPGAAGATPSASAAAAAASARERVVIHLDMDCFFAAAACVGRPEFAGLPLAVCHSASERGSGEVSSANYEARASGVGAGMFMSEAKRRCPDLVVVPYEFDRYEEISLQVYRILMRTTSAVQPLSCDEAYLDVTGLGDPEEIARRLRSQIAEATGCPASAGIGPNPLVARLATKRAKPNGQFRVTAAQALDFMADMAADQLPGVGWSMAAKLANEMGITTVQQVRAASKEVLCRRLGQKAGAELWAHAHGRDGRLVERPGPRKSVGAEVNWGVRFTEMAEATAFLKGIAAEVHARMAAAGVRGRTLTLKVKRRQAGAPEPAKFLGHGICDNASRSVTLARCLAGPKDIAERAAALLEAMQIPPEELRGLGITVSKLDNDASSSLARPTTPVPSKLPPAKHTVYDSSKAPAWMAAFLQSSAGGGGGGGGEGVGAEGTPQAKGRQEGGGGDGTPQAQRAAHGARGAGSGAKRARAGDAWAGWVERARQAGPGQQPGAGSPVDGADGSQEAAGSQEDAGERDTGAQRRLRWEGTGSGGSGGDGGAASDSGADDDSRGPGGSPRRGARRPSASPPPAAKRRAAEPRAAAPAAAPAAARASGIAAAAAVGASGGGARTGTPILALPPASQLDPDVLNALPLAMRLELEQAYGRCASPNAKPRAPAAPAAPRRRGAAAPAAPAAGHKRRACGAGAAAGARQARLFERPAAAAAAQAPLTLSQIDPEVLAALPEDVAREVLRALPPNAARGAAAAAGAAARAARGGAGGRAAAPGAGGAAAGGRARGGLPLLFGRTAGAGAAAAAAVPFAPESFKDVCAAARSAAAGLLGAASQQRPGAAGWPGGGAGGGGEFSPAPHAEGAGSDERGHSGGGGGGGGKGEEESRAKADVLCEWLAQWLRGRSSDLVTVSRGLRFLRQLPGWLEQQRQQQQQQQPGEEQQEEDGGAGPPLAAAAAALEHLAARCGAAEAAVRRHVEDEMGVVLL